jgi:ankyrin repeat protein
MVELNTIRDFMTAAHFDLPKLQVMLTENPELLNVQYDWGGGDLETGLQAGAHMGNRAITEYLLAQGAPMIICAAAMLGLTEQVAEMLKSNPADAKARGGHGIPVMFHAAMSGKVEIAQLLKVHGCTEGYDDALHGAIQFGHQAMVEWLLNNGAQNVNAKDFRGKTALTVAQEKGLTEIADLLRQRGAS